MYAFSVANYFGREIEPKVRADIVIYLAQVESISCSLGASAKNKYEAAIAHFDKSGILGVLSKSLKVLDGESIGKSLTALRADIVHYGRPKKQSERMSFADVISVKKCLEMIICSAIYKELGVPDSNIVEFQKYQLRFFPK